MFQLIVNEEILDTIREVALLSPEDANDTQIKALVRAAWRLIVDTIPEIKTYLESGKVSESSLIDVIAEIIGRRLRNPEGLRSTRVGEGPYSGEKVWAGDVDAGLYLLAREVRRLGGKTARWQQSYGCVSLAAL